MTEPPSHTAPLSRARSRREEGPRWRRALVTGASRGIGRALALTLAERKVDLVLVARDADLLAEVATEARATWSVDAEVLVADLSRDDDVARVEARLRVETKSVDLLVNNAAFVSTGKFWQQCLESELTHVGVNITAPVRLTHAVLPRMLGQRHGGICNMGSLIATIPTAGNASYSASKSFIETFTLALRQECHGSGVAVTLVSPGLVRTGSHERNGYDGTWFPQWSWLDERVVAAAAIEAISANRAVCIPGNRYKLIRHVARALPPTLTIRLFDRVRLARSSRDRSR